MLQDVARTGATFVDRQHMGVPLDLDQPFTDHPAAPPGAPAFDDPAGIPFWWERGALTSWQLVPLTLATIEQHRLWETSLFQPFKPLVDVTGGDPVAARSLAHALRCLINVGVLSEVDTITWRSAHAMLSSAQDFRPGCFGHQYHAWQATLDEDAVVFTTNPGNEPRAGDQLGRRRPLLERRPHAPHRPARRRRRSTSTPRSTRRRRPPLDTFGYLPYTHAYFPTERFDEVRQVGGWTFGRKGDGFVALWSWRPTEWRTHDPAATFTNGLTQPFDLVALGGAHNVWVSEVGDAGRWGSFDAFVAAVARRAGAGASTWA